MSERVIAAGLPRAQARFGGEAEGERPRVGETRRERGEANCCVGDARAAMAPRLLPKARRGARQSSLLIGQKASDVGAKVNSGRGLRAIRAIDVAFFSGGEIWPPRRHVANSRPPTSSRAERPRSSARATAPAAHTHARTQTKPIDPSTSDDLLCDLACTQNKALERSQRGKREDPRCPLSLSSVPRPRPRHHRHTRSPNPQPKRRGATPLAVSLPRAIRQGA
jgi:hypothetical protein